MRRKLDADQRRCSAHTRLTPAEDRCFRELAARLQTTRCRFLQKVIRESVGAGPDFLPVELTTIEEAVFQVGAVGRNLNQLMRSIHRGQIHTLEGQTLLITSIHTEVEKVRAELHDLMDRAKTRWVPMHA